MTSTVVTARAAHKRETPSTLFILILIAILGLSLALAVAYRAGGSSVPTGDNSIVIQGP